MLRYDADLAAALHPLQSSDADMFRRGQSSDAAARQVNGDGSPQDQQLNHQLKPIYFTLFYTAIYAEQQKHFDPTSDTP